MATTFTVTGFSCMGPFLALVIAQIAKPNTPVVNLILAALTYSVTFAAPFFVLALFPAWLKKLPKGGSWMTTIKVTMGFLELAFALKFLSNTDIAWFPGDPRLFNYDTVLCAYHRVIRRLCPSSVRDVPARSRRRATGRSALSA